MTTAMQALSDADFHVLGCILKAAGLHGSSEFSFPSTLTNLHLTTVWKSLLSCPQEHLLLFYW